jgi:F-type H+-transporting ATPase subunit gamma
MANLRDIRRRRKSVTNTKKITRTMELVASAKLKKAQDAALAARPYSEGLREIIRDLSRASGGVVEHPLMEARAVKTVEIWIATSDRGLCGAFNANLVTYAMKRADEHRAQGRTVTFIALGKKAASTLNFLGSPAKEVNQGIMAAPRYDHAKRLAEAGMDRFLNKDADLVEVVYAKFITASRQSPDVLALLPLGGESESEKSQAQAGVKPEAANDFIFHPNASELLAAIIPQTVKTMLHSFLLQTSAGEHAARRIAMKNATDAASDMGKALATAYNRGRQGKITQEISEIVGAVEAMA